MSFFVSSVDLAARLQELKKDDETIDGFGKAMKDWVSWLHCVCVCVSVSVSVSVCE